MRRLGIFGVAVLSAACSGTAQPASTTPGALTPNAVVLYVSDGDTIGVTIDGVEERVRLIGIDTPETKKPDSPVECFGPEASAFTESLLPDGTELYLERDIEARDPYGRLLAYVYRTSDGMFVNLEIITQGFARPLTIAPNSAHANEFVAAARAADAAGTGLWAACSG
jgi:micrococcal nuclease